MEKMSTENKIELEAIEYVTKRRISSASIDRVRDTVAHNAYIAGRSIGIETIKENAIGFGHWKDRHFKRTYPWTGYFYCLENYESVKLIPGVLYGEHYSFEQLYDMYVTSQK